MNLLRPELLCVIPCTQPHPLNQSRSSSVFSAEENSVISPCICSERPSQEHDQPGRGTCSQTHLASSLGADPGMQHNPKSEKLCHQQCEDTSAGPGFPVNMINNPWLVLAQNDDKRAASVSPGRENHIWSSVVASVFSMSWRIREPGVRIRKLNSTGLFPQSNWTWHRDRFAALPRLLGIVLCLCCMHPQLERKKETLLCFLVPAAQQPC